MCEIEHFVDPNDKQHPKFNKVKDYEVTLFSACNQLDGKPSERWTIGEAVNQVRCMLLFSVYLTCTNSLLFTCFFDFCLLFLIPNLGALIVIFFNFTEGNSKRNFGILYGSCASVPDQSRN